MSKRPLLTKAEVMEILRVKKTTLQGFLRRREIRYIKVGRRVLFDPEDVQGFLNRRAVSPKVERRQTRGR